MQQSWKKIINANEKRITLGIKEIWNYKDLIWMFVKRNFKSQYKQTILGPLWFIVLPLITSVLFTFVFGGIAGIETDGINSFVFYLCGHAIWSYFSTCFTNSASTFTGNAGIFSKVYFPRLVMPISNLIFTLLSLGIQIFLVIIFMIVCACTPSLGGILGPTWALALVPVVIIQAALLGLGCGIIVSSLTTKYRDLSILVGFGVSLWMYITPVVYPLSLLKEKWYGVIVQINPVTQIVNIFRYGFLGGNTPLSGTDFMFWGISWAVTLLVLFLGIILFNKTEKMFIDTV